MELSAGTIELPDGVRLYFQKLGNGPNIVIVPNGMYLLEDFRTLARERGMIVYDVRNRGRSDAVSDPAKPGRGIRQDVDDLEEVRRHFGLDRVDLIGHSYIGLMVALYAMAYPEHAGRVVQIGPMQPDSAKQYPEHLTWSDAVLAEVMAELARMSKETAPDDPEEACKRFSRVLRRMYVVNPADADRIDWGRCDLANERSFLQYWMGHLLPSIGRLNLKAEDFARATAPVLVVHGIKDRNAPYGGGRDWAAQLPNARLLAVDNAAHAPWIEAPELVFGSISAFLNGAWPETAEIV
jgi:proline iminopeptidase